jgi:hypothetical protein
MSKEKMWSRIRARRLQVEAVFEVSVRPAFLDDFITSG